jgi:DNA-binding NtrC family response regulator
MRLAGHGWRGNVRELENTVHRAVLLSMGNEIDAVELSGATASAAPAIAASGGVAGLVGCTMDQVEQDLILHTLTHTSGNRTHAATILGISIRALRNKLRDYAAAGLAVTPPGMAA